NAVDPSERGIGAALVLIMRLIGMTIGTAVMTGYGLRRVSTLLQRMIDEAGTQIDADKFVAIGQIATTRTINEMLLIASIICVIAIIPALLIHSRDVVVPADQPAPG